MFTTESILKWYYKEKERNKYQEVRMIVIFLGGRRQHYNAGRVPFGTSVVSFIIIH